MFKEKSRKIKVSPNKSKLDNVLWFIENYLPQKKNRSLQKKFYIDNLEADTIRLFSKLASQRYKVLFPIKKNTILSFTFGNWAIPYLKFLKTIGIAKKISIIIE
tara:strand:- start:160 stop:471 length:312 start_codon:yes stop_codon:yes gene_type:complete